MQLASLIDDSPELFVYKSFIRLKDISSSVRNNSVDESKDSVGGKVTSKRRGSD